MLENIKNKINPKKLAAITFIFFLLKGLAWLAIGGAAASYAIL